MADLEQLTVRQRLKKAIQGYHAVLASPQRQDLAQFQKLLKTQIEEFSTLQSIVDSLSLFSSSELLREINSAYLPFLSVPFYLAELLSKFQGNENGEYSVDDERKWTWKGDNLVRAKQVAASFLMSLHAIGGILSESQSKRLNSFSNAYDPSPEELSRLMGDPASRRAQKISEFKEESALNKKLAILDDYYNDTNPEEGDLFESMDEEVVRQIYLDQLKLQAIRAFGLMEAVSMEAQVLANRPTHSSEQKEAADSRVLSKLDAFDYTSRVERDPTKATAVSELINKQGRVLQPFVITNKREELRKQVFGTGQVLPSMSVEEYLDYELANGKMLKGEAPGAEDSDESDDSDEELRKREWDDWKDDNPKGSGNMKANLG
ncbi:hypothetical protein PUMCH_001526 [Australozyma saopauloensis]|uniref:TAP42-like protein n=1 Tax=Australozyma saopauloensis TaxID=291208 RepID=A0AAX4H708_9ASCO|nr:hypothetical protein PUMCH_001526 [[Candida] saopauloensis]